MKRRQLIWMSLLLLSFSLLPGLHGDNIHMRYFESADSFLMEARFQLFSYAAAADEQVTIVAYGVEGNLQPSIVMRDQNGQVIVEDRNESGNAVAIVDAEIPENGIYTFLVTRLSDEGGLMRVMLFEGEPIDIEASLLDTVDPFLPSRAYLLGGNTDEPVTVTLSVVDDESEAEDEAENTLSYSILAARGTSVSPPEEEAELTPDDSLSWANDQGDVFYTLNVRPGQAIPSASQKMLGYFSHMAQVADLTEIRIDVNGGTETPTQPDRQGECLVSLPTATETFAGPGETYIGTGNLTGGNYEVIGQNGEYLLIVDPASPSGGSWIPSSAVTTNPNCLGAVFEVNAPTPTIDNSIDNNQNSTNNNGGGGNPPPQGIGLPPLGNDPGGVQSGEPTEEEEETGEFIDNPEPTDPDEGGSTSPIVTILNCTYYDDSLGEDALNLNFVINQLPFPTSTFVDLKYLGPTPMPFIPASLPANSTMVGVSQSGGGLDNPTNDYDGPVIGNIPIEFYFYDTNDPPQAELTVVVTTPACTVINT